MRTLAPQLLFAAAAVACIAVAGICRFAYGVPLVGVSLYLFFAAVPLLALFLHRWTAARILFGALGVAGMALGINAAVFPPTSLPAFRFGTTLPGMTLLFFGSGVLLLLPRASAAFRYIAVGTATAGLVLLQVAVVARASEAYFNTSVTIYNASGTEVSGFSLGGITPPHALPNVGSHEALPLRLHTDAETTLSVAFTTPIRSRRVAEALIVQPGDHALLIIRPDLYLTAKVSFAEPAPSGVLRLSFVEQPAACPPAARTQ